MNEFGSRPQSASEGGPMTDTPPTFYDRLGVDPTASPEDIRKAYYDLARELHPDVNPDQQVQERFKRVTEAYAVLSDVGSRRAYNDALRHGGIAFTPRPDETSYPDPGLQKIDDLLDRVHGRGRYAMTDQERAAGRGLGPWGSFRLQRQARQRDGVAKRQIRQRRRSY